MTNHDSMWWSAYVIFSQCLAIWLNNMRAWLSFTHPFFPFLLVFSSGTFYLCENWIFNSTFKICIYNHSQVTWFKIIRCFSTFSFFILVLRDVWPCFHSSPEMLSGAAHHRLNNRWPRWSLLACLRPTVLSPHSCLCQPPFLHEMNQKQTSQLNSGDSVQDSC